MLSSITLLGSSSGRNAGDAALIAAIMDSIDRCCRTPMLYEIPTIKPGFVRHTYSNRVRPIGMMPWNLSLKMLGIPTWNSILRTDLSLIFDAILFDRALYNPLFNYLSSIYLMLPAARKHGRRMGMYNVGLGPIDTKRGGQMLRELCEIMDFITVRDLGSFEILKSLNIKNPRVLITADAALNLNACNSERSGAIMHALGLEDCVDILALNVSAYLDSWSAPRRKRMSQEKFVSIYAASINRVLKELDVSVLFVCTQYHDVSLSKAIISKIIPTARLALVSNIDYSPYEIMGILGRVGLLFGMRLHSIILASAMHTPVCALPHQPKVDHYLETLGLAQQSIGFDRFSEQDLAAHILLAWQKRAQIRDHLEQTIPILKAKALQGAELVAALHTDTNFDRFFIPESTPDPQEDPPPP